MKRSVLTPVLSGVLAVTVAGSGVGYYNVFIKDGGKASDSSKKDAKEDTKPGVITADKAAKTLEETIDKAVSVANGELDGGYKATITYKVPDSGELAELGLKDVGMTMEAKQKDKVSSFDYIINYGGEGILTLNAVYDNEGEAAYLKIPELSDAYLTGTADEIEQMMTEVYGTDFEELEAAKAETDVLDELNDYDFQALADDLLTYGDTLSENAPEATEGEKYTFEKDGVSIELDTKSYKITAQDAKKVAEAIADKAKQDATLKDFYVTAGIGDAAEYEEMWNDISIDEKDDTVVEVDVYYQDGEVVGYNTKSSDGGNFRMIAASTETDMIIDGGFDDDGDKLVIDGHLTYEADTLDGKVSMDMISDTVSMSYIAEYKSLTVTDDDVKGDIVYTIKNDGEEMVFSIKLDCSGNDADVTFSAAMGSESLGSINIKTQETNASDITIPTGTMYKITDENDQQKYLESCDVEGWQESLKGKLGDELYNDMFGMGYGSGDIDVVYGDSYLDYDWDYDYDWDDYDFGDYNWDDFDFSDLEEAV